MTAVLEVIDLRRSFRQGEVVIQVLRGVNASVGKGEIVALLGPSGSGKSTLLQAVGLLEGGFEGSIRIDGEEAASLQRSGATSSVSSISSIICCRISTRSRMSSSRNISMARSPKRRGLAPKRCSVRSDYRSAFRIGRASCPGANSRCWLSDER